MPDRFGEVTAANTRLPAIRHEIAVTEAAWPEAEEALAEA